MSEQENVQLGNLSGSVEPEQNESGWLTIDASSGLDTTVIIQPSPQLILRDKTGQEWAISVHPNGQLQTAKYPDGEPMTVHERGSVTMEDLSKKIADETLGAFVNSLAD